MRRIWIAMTLFAYVCAAGACDKKKDQGKENEQAPPPPEKVSKSAREQSGEEKGSSDPHADHDHEHEGSSKKIPAVTLPADGHLGAPFTLKKETSLSQILKDPKSFEGKKVLVSGKVEAQCRKRRRWFALSEGGKRPYLRVSTEPKFYIHSTAVSMKGKAEGVVKTRTVSVKEAKHFAKVHKLFGGDPSKITEPKTQVILKATGAQFKK